MKLTTLCDVTFVVFLVSWFITRHVLIIFVIKSTMVDSVRLVPEMWAPERGNYFCPLVHIALSVLMLSLEVSRVQSFASSYAHRHTKVLQVIWFGLICRAAYRIVIGQELSDERSEEEDE